MNTSLSEAMKDALASVPTNKTNLDTLTIINPITNETFYLANAKDDYSLTLETGETVLFQKSAFTFKLPNTGANGRQDLSLAMDNNDRRIIEFLVRVNESLAEVSSGEKFIPCIYRPYLLPDTSAPQINPPLSLILKGVSVKDGVINGKASFADVLNEPFPSENYTRERFPNLAG